ncbi:MAG TPA: hypothetical protein VFV99_31890 [Kofleriaceae bacterium]|nr:hypothetical protein [Kofleriaceae bacterium]
MKRQVLNLRNVLACLVVSAAGPGTALADNNAACPEEEANCPTHAQPVQQPAPAPAPMPAEQPTEEQRVESDLHKYGIAISAGGGVADWFSGGMRDLTGTSGTWDVRLYFGLRSQLGAEVAYVGRASSLDTPFNAAINSTTLYGNGVEVLGRLNVVPDMAVQPFVFLGVGWTRFNTTDTLVLADTGVNDSSDTLAFPLGAGVDWKAPFGLLVDARFAFIPTTNDDFIANGQTVVINNVPVVTGGFLDLDSWNFSANVGYAF